MAKVCCCSFFPGLHPRYLNCDPEEAEFIPNEKEEQTMKECQHWPIDPEGHLEDVDVNVIDGVCLSCGKVVNEEEAREANQRNC